MHIYIYIYIYTHSYIPCIYIYIYIEREREKSIYGLIIWVSSRVVTNSLPLCIYICTRLHAYTQIINLDTRLTFTHRQPCAYASICTFITVNTCAYNRRMRMHALCIHTSVRTQTVLNYTIMLEALCLMMCLICLYIYIIIYRYRERDR